MTPERWRQVEELYQAARDPHKRASVLAAADPELRSEVEALLAQDDAGSTVTHVGSGMQVGSYRIEAPLGEGGMGVVYRALDIKLNRPVAIKFLSNELADAEARHRFQREAQMASSLNHPHILTVYDAGDFEGRQYLVTEFVDGGTLKTWAKQEKRNWRRIVELLTGVADGLAAAHQAGILHRDIKPDNVLVAKNGYAKLADFGLAKLAEGPAGGGDLTRTLTEGATRKGVIIGTIAYMSPEQASGKTLDGRSDIFSFGVVLYELLAGKRPFNGATDLEVLKTIIHGDPPSLGEEVPPALRGLVEKALEKDPAERYQSMRDFVVDLRRLARQKVAVVPAAAPAKTRGRWLPWIVAAGFAALAAGIGLWEARGPAPSAENPLANAKVTRLTDFPGDEMDAAISPDGKFVAFVADRDGPFDIFLSQVGSGTFANLTHGKQQGLEGTYRPVGFSGDGTEIWLHDGSTETPVQIMPLMGGQPRVFLGTRSFNVAWSPDGARLTYHTSDNGDPMFVADSSGANVRKIFGDRPGAHNHFPVWSPDGKWIYFASGIRAANAMDLWRIRPSGGAPERLTQHNASLGYPAPIDQRTVLYVAEDADGSGPWLWALDVESKLTRRISFGLERYTSVASSAGGRRLVASVANPSASLSTVPILDRPAEERDVKPFPLPTIRALMPRFGGTALFYRGGGDGLWRYQDGQAQEIWKGADGALLEPPAVAPDGRRVAFVQRRNGKFRLQVETADGAEPQLVAQDLDVQGTACWSPDGKVIVIGGSDAEGPGLFKIPMEGGALARLAMGFASNPACAPDGSLIAYAGVNVGRFAPLLAMRPDGSRIDLPEIKLNRNGERIRFLPNGKGLVYMQGQGGSQDFWLLDLATKKSRPLTHLTNTATMRTFDITPDGKQIVFDRLRDNSDIVLIDLPKKP